MIQQQQQQQQLQMPPKIQASPSRHLTQVQKMLPWERAVEAEKVESYDSWMQEVVKHSTIYCQNEFYISEKSDESELTQNFPRV